MKYTVEEIETAIKKVIGDGQMTQEHKALADTLMTSEYVHQQALQLFLLILHNPDISSVLTVLTLGLAAGIEVEHARAAALAQEEAA